MPPLAITSIGSTLGKSQRLPQDALIISPTNLTVKLNHTISLLSMSSTIKQELKINTLAGSCKTKEVVIMRNLRLPELDKNCVFDGDCKYDVILGAEFLSKSGIDIKYSTGIIKWFDNELPMRDPHQLDGKEYVAMADILEVQRKANVIFDMV